METGSAAINEAMIKGKTAQDINRFLGG